MNCSLKGFDTGRGINMTDKIIEKERKRNIFIKQVIEMAIDFSYTILAKNRMIFYLALRLMYIFCYASNNGLQYKSFYSLYDVM